MAAVVLAIFCLLIFSFIPPFSLPFLRLRMMLEPKPETLVNQGVPIAQAIVDYRNDHGLFPEKIMDLVPKYLPKEPSKEWQIEGTALIRHGGQPHSYIYFYFMSSEWIFQPDNSLMSRKIKVIGPAPGKAPLTGEALFAVKTAEYENRIRKHPHEIWFSEEKICFLGLRNRTELLLPECERAAKEFPDWWLPQMALALFSLSLIHI